MVTAIEHRIQNGVSVFTVFGRTMEGDAHIFDVTGFIFEIYCVAFSDASLLRAGFFNETGVHFSHIYKTKKMNLYGYTTEMSDYYCIGLSKPTEIDMALEYLRSMYEQPGLPFFNSDIDPVIRFINYLNIKSWIRVVGEETNPNQPINISSVYAISLEEQNAVAPLKILSFDIECVCNDNLGGFPTSKKDPIIQIGNVLHITDTDVMKKTMFMLNTSDPIEDTEIFSFTSETNMLQAWSKYVIEADPDMFSGYFIAGFDFDYILERMTVLGISSARKFGRRNKNVTSYKMGTQGSKQMGVLRVSKIGCFGRIIFDMYGYMFHNYKLRSYSLNAVSDHFLNERKEDVDYAQIKPLFEGSSADRMRLVIYCIKDALLPLRLMANTKAIVKTISLSRVCHVPTEYILQRGQQIRMVALIGNAIRDTDYIWPDGIICSGEKYTGATVLDPIVGFHNTPIATLDYASLYPSIIIAHNLCYTTFVSQVHKLSEDQYVLSPLGYGFVKSSVKRGVLPEICERLLTERAAVRKRMKSIVNKTEYEIYDGLQNAIKITTNSIYGFTGALTFGKLPCKEISSSVTAYGREMLMTTCTYIEKYYPRATIVYGDTDSVMVDFKSENVEAALKIGSEAAAQISTVFPRPIHLEFEKVYFPFLLLAKKRYTGVYWTKSTKYDRIDYKGVEIVRRDNCKLVGRVMKESVNLLLLHGDLKGIEKLLFTTIQNIVNDRCDVAELVISKSYSREDYKVIGPHVNVANRLRSVDPNNAPKVGDRVPYLIVENFSRSNRVSDCAVHPMEYISGNLKINHDYYLKQLQNSVNRLFETVEKLNIKKIFINGRRTYAKRDDDEDAGVGLVKIHNAFDILMRRKKPSYNTEVDEVKRYHAICSECLGDKFKVIECKNIHCNHFFLRNTAYRKLAETLAPKDLIKALSFYSMYFDIDFMAMSAHCQWKCFSYSFYMCRITKEESRQS